MAVVNRIPSPVHVVEDKMYIAVGRDVRESKSVVTWALRNSGGRKICILYVLEPAQWISGILGAKFAVSQLGEQEVRALREGERQKMNKLLQDYCTMCGSVGVHAEVVHIEMNSIEKGIVELIKQDGIRKLVMGAAADKHYSERMLKPKSRKAIYVSLQAPMSCHIWFICKGNLVHTREGRSEGVSMEDAFPTLQAGPNAETGQSSSLRSKSVAEKANDQLRLTNSGQNYRRAWSALPGLRIPTLSSNRSSVVTPHSSSIAERSSVDWDESRSFDDMADVSALSKEDHHQFSSPPSVLEGHTSEEFYGPLQQSMAEAENSRREAFEEDASDAIHIAKALERLYAEEVSRRKEVEEALARGKEELKKMKQQMGQVAEELHTAVEHKSSPERQIANFSQMVKDLEQKLSSAVELLQKYKKERDEFQAERDNALKEAEELRKEQAEASDNTLAPEFFYEFSFSEIKEATSSFDPSLKIGEGGYGNIYKCLLRHTEVAIKMRNPNSKQGPSEYQQEVNVLSKLRHPNIVTLIGACPEDGILVYEYLPNGSLEDRLSCKDNSPPLSWQTRIRIATELCSALNFLHSCYPNRVIHGDLKPANVLLDSNFVSKLSDFGICRILDPNGFSRNDTTLCCITDHPGGTIGYMDPLFASTGEMTAKSDVYSFGIILLQLLTGRPAKAIAKEVKCALDEGNLKNLLDPTAGDWPFEQAQQLAHIALRCCEMNRQSRPDLATDEIMQDPHVAADEYTYELEAFKRWLDEGHDTSSVTKLKLPHFNLVPNCTLQTAIREWL
ncbi:hypothetical protein Vadar_022844 [Vaccinium darrowii]|uniref:Uncharacterized protein n=1 Tax=Vaccinium darrowii TaxID=229202 RepID=A0ACB7ZDN8_9ERIC|nr:hypothetical protein Vadar_022844 [Vaccinium darrowii]